MERECAIPSLHELLAVAVERAGCAQEESRALIDRQRAMTASLDDTIGCIQRRRRATVARTPAFGNGHRGAKLRSGPG